MLLTSVVKDVIIYATNDLRKNSKHQNGLHW